MEGKMKNLIALTTLTLALSTSLLAANNSILAEVSFERRELAGPRDVVYAPRAYSIQLLAHGEIQVMDVGAGDQWFIQPVKERPAYRLSEREYDWVMGVIYLLGEAELVYSTVPGICRMAPPLVNSDLYVLGYQEDYSLVLSESGCWRDFSTYPAEERLYQEAVALKEWLLSIGEMLLNG